MNNRVPHYSRDEDGILVFDLETRRLFKKLMNKLFEAEVEAEEIRQVLSKRYLFDIGDAFAAIDAENNGFITLDDFKNIL